MTGFYLSEAALMLAAPREGGNGTMIFIIQMAAIFAIFYFLLIRPHRQEQKKHDQMIESLGKGDEVVTNGGIIGTIIHADEGRLTIKTGNDTRIVVQRGRIAQKLVKQGEGE